MEEQQAPSTSSAPSRPSTSTSTSDETASLAERIVEREKNLKRYVDDALRKNHPKGIGNPMDYDILLNLMEKAMQAYPYPAASIVDVCSIEELKQDPTGILRKYRNKTADEYVHQLYPENTLKQIHSMVLELEQRYVFTLQGTLDEDLEVDDPDDCLSTELVLELVNKEEENLIRNVRRILSDFKVPDFRSMKTIEHYKRQISPRIQINAIVSEFNSFFSVSEAREYFYDLSAKLVEKLTPEIKDIYAAIHQPAPNLIKLSVFNNQSPNSFSVHSEAQQKDFSYSAKNQH